METDDLDPGENARLEALLQEGLALPPLPDDGFSRRVRRALAAEGLPWYRGWLALGWAGLASGVALALWALGAAPDDAAAPWAALLGEPWVLAALGLALACIAATGCLALRARRT